MLLLSGCGVTQPAPATQVTAGNSTPMFSTTKWCTASLKDKDNNSIDLGIVFIDDKDNSYVVRNKNNKVVGVSPTLVQTTPTMMVGTLGKITYSRVLESSQACMVL